MNRLFLESQMMRNRFCIAANLIVGLLVIIGSYIGSFGSFNWTNESISPIWPATGVSLAALLLLGYRVSLGIFLGNFIFNSFKLLGGSSFLVEPLLIDFIISIGSLSQALLAAIIIRNFSSRYLFQRVNDIFIFLIPAGLLCHLIGATTGTFTLFYFQLITWDQLYPLWLTFWFGDILGVYIITPLLITWLTHDFDKNTIEHWPESILMLLTFLIITYYSYYLDYPVAHLFLPWAIWVTFRFNMHGATVANFIGTIVSIIPTLLGVGAFVANIIDNQLFIMISFFFILIGTTLLIAASIQERKQAWYLINKRNRHLTKEMDSCLKNINDLSSNLYVQEKLASLGVLINEIARCFKTPVENIRKYSKESVNTLLHMENISRSDQEYERSTKSIHDSLNKVIENQKHVEKMLELIQQQSNRITPSQMNVLCINLHTFINQILEQFLQAENLLANGIPLNIIKNYDGTIPMIPAFPEDLGYVFQQVFENATDSMVEKRHLKGALYNPILEIKTKNQNQSIQIIIRDNGVGVDDSLLETLREGNCKCTDYGFGLVIANQIIQKIHNGSIHLDSTEGEYFQVTISLPSC